MKKKYNFISIMEFYVKAILINKKYEYILKNFHIYITYYKIMFAFVLGFSFSYRTELPIFIIEPYRFHRQHTV